MLKRHIHFVKKCHNSDKKDRRVFNSTLKYCTGIYVHKAIIYANMYMHIYIYIYIYITPCVYTSCMLQRHKSNADWGAKLLFTHRISTSDCAYSAQSVWQRHKLHGWLGRKNLAILTTDYSSQFMLQKHKNRARIATNNVTKMLLKSQTSVWTTQRMHQKIVTNANKTNNQRGNFSAIRKIGQFIWRGVALTTGQPPLARTVLYNRGQRTRAVRWYYLARTAEWE
jgi:hypothetical protein